MSRIVWLVCCGMALVGTAACRAEPSRPLSRAAATGDLMLLERLLEATQVDEDDAGWTPLVWAARAGQYRAVERLLRAGADPNRPSRGWTPLMHAIHRRQPEIALLLIASGADPRLGTVNNSPLQMAALDGDHRLIRVILAANPPREQQLAAFDVAVSGGVLADLDRGLAGQCRPGVVGLLTSATALGQMPDTRSWRMYVRDCRTATGGD